jgi:K+-transporting ATPase ATPase A chain
MIPLVNMMLGEVVFGGVGAGLYGMLIMIILTIFVAGQLVGRTPEYLGKKIEAKEVKLALLATLVFPLTILSLSAWSCLASYGISQINNQGPHGLSEIVYAYTSATGNNGSAFAGLNANTLWYNTTLGLAMLIGRFQIIVPMMAIAGSLAAKRYGPPSAGTFPVETPLFVILLISVIMIIAALTFFPVLSLGPIVEQLLLKAGRVF